MIPSSGTAVGKAGGQSSPPLVSTPPSPERPAWPQPVPTEPDDWRQEPSFHDSEVDFLEYLRIIVRHRFVILAFTAAGIVLAVAYVLLKTPLYRATATVDLGVDAPNPLDVESYRDKGGQRTAEFIPSEVEILRSRQVVSRAIRKLDLHHDQEFTGRSDSPLLGSSGTDTKKPGSKETELAETALVEGAVSQVQRNLEIKLVRGTRLVQVSYSSPSPRIARDVANAVSASYVEWNGLSRFRSIGNASKFLKQQIEDLQAEVNEKEERIQAYSKQKDIVSMDPQSNVTIQKLQTLNRDYAASVTDRVAKEARYFQLKQAKPDTLKELASDPLVVSLRTDLARYEGEYIEKLNLYREEWPGMKQLRAKIDEIKRSLAKAQNDLAEKLVEQSRGEFLTAERREQQLRSVLEAQGNEAMTLNTNAIEYNNLKVELSTKRALLDVLLKRQAETEITARLSGVRESPVVVLDEANIPKDPYSPAKKRSGGMGLFLGVASGVGFAFLLHYLDRSIRTPEEATKILQLPVLGTIPDAKVASGKRYGYGYGYSYRYGYGRPRLKSVSKPEGGEKPAEEPGEEVIEIATHKHPRSMLAEAFRDARASLLLSRPGGLHSFVVTSSLPSEGKSTACINLAIALSQLGKSVVLIDSDMHNPRLHKVFKQKNRAGLANFLVESAPFASLLLKTEIPGVSLLPAGPMAPNPSALISSPQMSNLLSVALSGFDFVIFDSPPLDLISDALILTSMTDGVILTVRAGATPRDTVRRQRDRLEQTRKPILGILLNRFIEPSLRTYGKYGKYGKYKYGYSTYGDPKPGQDAETEGSKDD